MRVFLPTLLKLLPLLLFVVMSPPVLTQSADDIKAVIQIDTDGQPPLDIHFLIGHEKMRLDMPQSVSVISVTGDNPRTLIVQHAEKRYVEWGSKQLETMQQLLQQVQRGDGGQETDTFKLSKVQFEQSGLTEKIGDWNAFQVLMRGSDSQKGALWLTTDAGIGLFEISHRATEAATILQNPIAGGRGAPQQILQLRSLAESQRLPDGRVVRIVSQNDNRTDIITLLDIEIAPLQSDTFDPPEGYEQMQIPLIP